MRIKFQANHLFLNDNKNGYLKNSHFSDFSDILSLKMNVKKMTGIFFTRRIDSQVLF